MPYIECLVEDYLSKQECSYEWFLDPRTYFDFKNPPDGSTLHKIAEKLGDRATTLAGIRSISEYGAQGADGGRTVDRQLVKSFGEVFIYNWLVAHGFEVEYEREYPHQWWGENPANGKKYEPDFYLPEHDIWIEHFGTDKEGKPPPKSGNYLKEMKDKRRTHKQNGTTLIETAYGQLQEGTPFKELDKQLRAHEAKPKRLPWKKFVEKVAVEPNFSPTVNLLDRFLALFKSNGHAFARTRRISQHAAPLPSLPRPLRTRL